MLKKIFSNLIRVNENINRIVKRITKLMQKELRFELSRELKILRKEYLLIGKYDTNKNNKNCKKIPNVSIIFFIKKTFGFFINQSIFLQIYL
jgi:Iap family predicted aminopeptidase